MTDDERNDEGAEEAIEDLEAPADAQDDVVGGMCTQATAVDCRGATCKASEVLCRVPSCGDTSKGGPPIVQIQQ